jgi:hypothetical protein
MSTPFPVIHNKISKIRNIKKGWGNNGTGRESSTEHKSTLNHTKP